ncbi:MAG: hypothetical protein WKF73_05025 [Nocardioidaceae bacterium]
MTYVAHAERGDAVLPISWDRVFTAWTWEPLPLLAMSLIGLGYLGGVWALRRRGDRWPVTRTLSFMGGGSVRCWWQRALPSRHTTPSC